MADTPDFNTLPVDTPNSGKKVSGVMRLINAVTVFIQNVRIANEATDPVQVGGPLLTSLDSKAPALVGGAVPVVNAAGATAAKQDTGNASLAMLAANSPALLGGAVPVVAQGTSATHADRSGTITAGGTAQALMAANASRRGWWLQNLSTGDLWVSGVGTAAAVQPSLKIVAGAYYESPSFVSPTALSIFGATTGQAFAAREY